MSTNGRKDNRTSTPSIRGGSRRNTQPPPSVRMAPEVDPISTSRPRGNEGPDAIPAQGKPPADIVAAASAAGRPVEPEPTAKTPPVVAAPPPVVPPARAELPTLESVRTQGPAIDDDGPAMSQPAPSFGPRNSLTGTPGSVRRKGRGGNLKPSSGRTSAPPPSMSPMSPAAPAVRSSSVSESPAVSEPISSRATVPAPIVEEAPAKANSEAPLSAPPPSDLDERFFDHDAPRDDGSDVEYDDRMAQKNSPEARARREKNWTYVRWMAVICVPLMAVALIRSGMRHDDVPEPPPVVTIASHGMNDPAPPDPPAAVATPQPAVAGSAAAAGAGSAIPTVSTDDLPAAPGAPSAAAAPSSSAKFQEPMAALGVAAKAQGTDPAMTAPIAVPIPADPTEAERKSAGQEKRSCQSFLDQGAFAKAVAAGERSVALDPADGEAWLMLGAAYQSMGKTAEARRSFSSCVAEAKKGPIGECRSMLR